MEKKIKSMVSNIFRLYGSDKSFDSTFKEDRIVTLCMNELASHPMLEKELDTDKKIHYFVMQMILDDISLEKIERIC